MEFNLLHRDAILTDVQNLKIHFTPLEATLYYFFLKYPRGIKADSLGDYEGELYEIYSRCAVFSGGKATLRRSIKAMTDPLENSLYEKLSKIRAKFEKALGDELAGHYVIRKKDRSGKYKINIDRKLVFLID